MKLQTFFEKFDQFADAPHAVAKMRALVLEFAVRARLLSSGNPDSSVPFDPSAPFPIPHDWQWITLTARAVPLAQSISEGRQDETINPSIDFGIAPRSLAHHGLQHRKHID